MADERDNTQVIRLVETPYDLEGRDIVCYPNLILLFKIGIHRVFMKPRIVYSAITVDLVKGEAARANKFPSSQRIEISNEALIPQMIAAPDAMEAATQIVLKWLRHKYKIYKPPELELIKRQEVYKAFFYTQDHKQEPLLVDSVKGIELDDPE